MKGFNELILNKATMIEALQFWLNSKMKIPVPTVIGVETKMEYFTISLESDQETKEIATD